MGFDGDSEALFFGLGGNQFWGFNQPLSGLGLEVFLAGVI